jgi:hypothetical protein
MPQLTGPPLCLPTAPPFELPPLRDPIGLEGAAALGVTTSSLPETLEADLSVNYLHYGDSLSELTSLLQHRQESAVLKAALLTATQGCDRMATLSASDVVREFGGRRKLKLDLRRLREELEASDRWRDRFQALHLRGFSFRLTDRPRFDGCRLNEHVTRQFALLHDPGLYCPPRVRAALKQGCCDQRHIAGGIGWMLGVEAEVESEPWWVIVNIQSDLTSARSSSLRGLYRGWQRLLLWLIAGIARRRGVAALALPGAASVPGMGGGIRPHPWHGLYDGTARFFGMTPVRLQHRLDIQPMRFTASKWCSDFWACRLNED